MCSVQLVCTVWACFASAFGNASVFSGKAAVNISSAAALLSVHHTKEAKNWLTFFKEF